MPTDVNSPNDQSRWPELSATLASSSSPSSTATTSTSFASSSLAAPASISTSSSSPSSQHRPSIGPHGSSTSSTLERETGRSILITLLRLDLRIHDNALFHYAHRTAVPLSKTPLVPHDGLHNGHSLKDLCSQAEYLLPVYVFDEREIELSGLPGYERRGGEARTRHYKFWKTGVFRARFVMESVYDLRSRLREAGSDLLIRFGTTEEVVENLVKALQKNGDHVEGVWMQKEMTAAEQNVESEIRTRLETTQVPLRFISGKTLVDEEDLPFAISEMPDVFTPFRKRVETLGSRLTRPLLDPPKRFKPFPRYLPSTPDYALDVTYEVDVDGLAERPAEQPAKSQTQTSFHDILFYILSPLRGHTTDSLVSANSTTLQQRHPASAFPFRGGESSALERLDWYFVRGKSADSARWGKADPPPVAWYKRTRNNLIGHAYSTKMSPYLAYGSISPRQIWNALDYHERLFGEDQNTYWVRFELLWRDFFFFATEKFGPLLYELGGFEEATDPKQAAKKTAPGWWKMYDPDSPSPDHDIVRLLEGRTGIPFIDANVLELRETGFMSNRGRQNVASFLSKDLGYDWRIGAEFFESFLIDHDPTSNYGNWQYVAGVGNDPRASRQFNCIKQAKDYDAHGDYVKLWIPALRNLHLDSVHTPWLLDEAEKKRYGLKSTKSEVSFDRYPAAPLIELESWHKHYTRKPGMGSKMMGNPQEKVKDVLVGRSAWRSGQWRGAESGSGGASLRSGSAPTLGRSGDFGRSIGQTPGGGLPIRVGNGPRERADRDREGSPPKWTQSRTSQSQLRSATDSLSTSNGRAAAQSSFYVPPGRALGTSTPGPTPSSAAAAAAASTPSTPSSGVTGVGLGLPLTRTVPGTLKSTSSGLPASTAPIGVQRTSSPFGSARRGSPAPGSAQTSQSSQSIADTATSWRGGGGGGGG